MPATLDELVTLHGVGRKTAAVVSSNAFGRRDGIAVDTHVGRVSRRLGLTRHSDPVKVERALMRLYPRERWLQVSDVLIFHGRRVCEPVGPAAASARSTICARRRGSYVTVPARHGSCPVTRSRRTIVA